MVFDQALGLNLLTLTRADLRVRPKDAAITAEQVEAELERRTAARADKEMVCIGIKASNYFMPKATLSDKGPGGGGWIYINKKLQV